MTAWRTLRWTTAGARRRWCSLFVQQAADLADQQHVFPLVIAAIAAPLDRLELVEFLLPVAQHVGFDAAQLAHFADGEVFLRRDFRQYRSVAVTLIQHRNLPLP